MTTRPTRSQRYRSHAAGVLLLAGGAAAWSVGGGLAARLSGHGWHPAVAYPSLRGLGESLRGDETASLWQVVPAPAPTWLWVTLSLAIGLPWAWLVTRTLLRTRDPRAAALASPKELQPLLSKHAVRKAAKFTRPDLPWARIWLPLYRVPLTELGYFLGYLEGTRHQLWANFELRVRVIARTGWGKSARLLVKIARGLPGAALISSTKPDVFEQTVMERIRRGHKVMVVDFSDPTARFAAGYDRVRWDPVLGCRDVTVALRRARGLVSGTEDGDRTDDHDGFFRDAAMHVIAAWLHAAALGRKSMDDVLKWQRNISLTEPHDIIDRHRAAEPATRVALLKHLDDRSERTTSSVERFVANALYPFATRDGADFARPPAGQGVDVEQLIRDQVTVYLLASPVTAGTVAPLLTLFAEEWLQVCRQVAISLPGRRLPVPAVALLDELRGGVTIPSLPQVAYEMRAYGVGCLYGVQNAHQEDELYGPAAESLAQNVQVTIVGGYDRSIAEDLTKQAGPALVPSVHVSGGLLEAPAYNEGGEWKDAIDARDQQLLGDGQAVVRMVGASLFKARTPSFRDDRSLRRQIGREERQVRATVTAAQATAAAERDAYDRMAQAAYDAPRSV